MNIRGFKIAILLCLIPAVFFSQSAIAESFTMKRDDGSLIHYYLDFANTGHTSDCLLVILQGSDCNSVRRNPSIAKLRSTYPAADLLTVEKYGITEDLAYSKEVERPDCPPAYLSHDNPMQRADDVENVLEYLRGKYAYEKVIVVGGSEGSDVALILTSRASYINATIAFGGGGRWFSDDVLHSIRSGALPEQEAEKSAEGFQKFAQHILASGPFEVSMSNHGYTWWRSMLSLDKQALLEMIDTPVLLVHGGNDNSVSVEKAIEMTEYLRGIGKTNIESRIYEGMDHALNLSHDDPKTDTVISEMRSWLEKTLER
ncbi:MAG: prolyl oligopeptidase family serine peptidase [Bacteroidota bacterium]